MGKGEPQGARLFVQGDDARAAGGLARIKTGETRVKCLERRRRSAVAFAEGAHADARGGLRDKQAREKAGVRHLGAAQERKALAQTGDEMNRKARRRVGAFRAGGGGTAVP